MEMIEISVQIEARKLDALNFFLFDKQNTSLKTELQNTVDAMYIKHVPEDTRHYIDAGMKSDKG